MLDYCSDISEILGPFTELFRDEVAVDEEEIYAGVVVGKPRVHKQYQYIIRKECDK